MKASLFLTVFFTGTLAFSANAAKPYNFQFNKASKLKVFSITQTASSKEEAYKLAAKECFKMLTGNKYPGEEKGLEIIDICANPKM